MNQPWKAFPAAKGLPLGRGEWLALGQHRRISNTVICLDAICACQCFVPQTLAQQDARDYASAAGKKHGAGWGRDVSSVCVCVEGGGGGAQTEMNK